MKTEEFPETAEEILDEAEKTSDSEKRQKILAKAAKAFVKAGRLDLARRTLERIKDPYWRSTTLKTILSKLHESGEVDESRRVIESTLNLSRKIKDVFQHVKTLVNISEAFAKIDCRERGSEIAMNALNMIEGIKDPDRLLGLLPSIVNALAETGNIDKAREKAEQIENGIQRSIAFMYIVRALAGNEKATEAMDFVDRIKDPDHRSQAHMYIGLALLRAKRGEEARKIAKEIRDPNWRSHIVEWSKKVEKDD